MVLLLLKLISNAEVDVLEYVCLISTDIDTTRKKVFLVK